MAQRTAMPHVPVRTAPAPPARASAGIRRAGPHTVAKRPVFEVVERQSSTPARPARSAPAGQPGAGRRGERAPPAKTPPPRPPPPSFTALRESPPSYDEVLRLDAAAMAGLGPGSRTSVPCLAGTGDLIDFDTPIFSPASVPSPAPDPSPAPIASTALTPSTVRSPSPGPVPSPAPTPSSVLDPSPVLAPSPAPLPPPASSTSLRGNPPAPSRLSLGSRVSTVSLGSGEPSPGPGTEPAACAGLAPPQDPPGGDSPPVRAPPRGQFRSAGAAGRGRVAEGVRPARRSSRQTAPDGTRGSGEAADRAADRRRSLGRDAAQAPVDRAVSGAGGGEGSLGGVSGTPPDPAAGGLGRDSSPGGAAGTGGTGTAPPGGVQGPDRRPLGTSVSTGIGLPADNPTPCHGDSPAETCTPSDPPPAIQGQNDPPARLDSRSPEGPAAPCPDRRESSSADSGRGGGSPCASGSSGSGHEDRPTDAAWDSLPEPADCACGPDTPQAIALYDFRSTEPGDLSFKEGDTVRLLRWVDADWLLGRLGGRQGLVPALYVSVTVPLPGGRMGPPPPPPLARQLSQDGVRAMALYDFAAQEQYDLGFQAGDLVLVLGKLNDDWGYGSRRGRSGQFPLVYLDVDIDQLPEL